MSEANHDQISLNLIQYWRDGSYDGDCQRYAKLQVLVAEALENESKRNENIKGE